MTMGKRQCSLKRKTGQVSSSSQESRGGMEVWLPSGGIPLNLLLHPPLLHRGINMLTSNRKCFFASEKGILWRADRNEDWRDYTEIKIIGKDLEEHKFLPYCRWCWKRWMTFSGHVEKLCTFEVSTMLKNCCCFFKSTFFFNKKIYN